MATYSNAIQYVQSFNVTSSGTTISFTVGTDQYYQVCAIGAPTGSTSLVITLAGIQVFNGTHTPGAPFTGLNGSVIGEGTAVSMTITGAASFTLFGNLIA